MFAIYLLGIALGYLLLAVITTIAVVKITTKRGASKRTRMISAAVTLFIFWLIPFWDWIPTVVYHKHLCSTEAGVKIYRSVEGVEGFLAIGTGEITLAEKWGYKYVDMLSSEGIRRPRKNEGGGLPLYFFDPPNPPSIYGYKHEATRGLPWRATRHTFTTYIIATGEVLGTFIDFSYTAADTNAYGSEWNKPWLNSEGCYDDRSQRALLEKSMVLNTLEPAQSAK